MGSRGTPALWWAHRDRVGAGQGAVVYALQKYEFIVLFPINPSLLAKYREAFRPSRAKDDPTDAQLALELMRRYPHRFTPLEPQSVAMRTLGFLVEQRRLLVDDRKRLVNRLGNTLKQYYPQVLAWFEQHNTRVFADFLIKEVSDSGSFAVELSELDEHYPESSWTEVLVVVWCKTPVACLPSV